MLFDQTSSRTRSPRRCHNPDLGSLILAFRHSNSSVLQPYLFNFTTPFECARVIFQKILSQIAAKPVELSSSTLKYGRFSSRRPLDPLFTLFVRWYFSTTPQKAYSTLHSKTWRNLSWAICPHWSLGTIYCSTARKASVKAEAQFWRWRESQMVSGWVDLVVNYLMWPKGISLVQEQREEWWVGTWPLG